MKTYKMKTHRFITMLLLAFLIGSCSEDELQEVPLDFLSPENSFTDPEGIQSALNPNYATINSLFDGLQIRGAFRHVGTDLSAGARNPTIDYFGDYTQLNELSGVPASMWSAMYSIISRSNTVLNRIEDVPYPSEEAKNVDIGEARFFRAYAYKALANLFGGVPLLLEEVSSPKTDFVRATREAVYNQAIEDMLFAANNLPGVNDVSIQGRVNSAVANHFLSELYISVGLLDEAIASANRVIDNPDIGLMTERFGRKSGEEGDPYWDLFQAGNQNRGNGNTEGLWVLQEAFNIPGGSGPQWFDTGGFYYERCYGPLFWQLKDENDVALFNNVAHTFNGGRGVGFVRPTNYFSYTIWDAANRDIDIRNNNRNIIRDWEVLNPESIYFGGMASEAKAAFISQDTTLRWYPQIGKTSTPNDHPAELLADATLGTLIGTSGKTYADWYLVRVAETYLLRAEAKLGKGDLQGAADDINALRNRANAVPVVASDIDIDYILDERMRELNIEEARRMTLSRLGKLYDRTVLGNQFAGLTIQPFQNLYPIPFSEIERNNGAVLEQNPGY